MFHLHRFHRKRGRAALALLPVIVMMFATAAALAQTEPTPVVPEGPEATTSAGRTDTAVRLVVNRHVMAGDRIKIRGKVRPRGKRRVTVRVSKSGTRTIRSRKDGTFAVRWRAPRPGIYRVKATVRGTEQAKPARTRTRAVNAYRASQASFYGPGLYGNGTACGRTLTASTVGVANKSLPCGTKVTFRFRGRTVRAPVIDRGPYAGNREWDLTAALKAKLGFGSTGVVLSTK